MSRQATLTRHAISPPAFEGGKVHRERLVDALHASIPRRLVAVIAPAGYGKTTLLADFAAHTELPICWLRLTEGDRDPMRMAGVLQASLASRFRRLRRTLRVEAMAGADEGAVAMAFAHAIRSGVEEPFVLIVDDVHLVNDSSSVMSFWKTFLEHQPEQVTLMMAGREVPNVPMDGLLERGQVAGLGPLELALTGDELRELSRRAFGKDLGEEDLERLKRETGGWVMGVLLSGAVPVSGLGVLVQSQRPMVYDYLAAVVLNRQPRALREFLLHSAVLPVMTAEACDEVLRRGDSGRMLLHAMRGGMFLSSTGERPKTYEYHPQFREFLLATLQEEDAAELRRLRVRAGGHLARQGSIEAAVDLYLEAGDTRRAGRLAEKHARAIRRAGKLDTLERWRERLKGEERAYVGLSLQLATGLVDRGKLSVGKMLFAKSARCSQSRGWVHYSAMAFIGLATVAWQSQSFRTALRHARRAVDYSTRQNDRLVQADALRWLAHCLMTYAASRQEALDLIDRAVGLVRRHGDPHSAAVFLVDRFIIADELGAAEASTEAMNALRGFGSSEDLFWLRPFVVRCLVYGDIAEGKYSEALRRAESAAESFVPSLNPREVVYLAGIRGYLLGLAGRTDEALRLLDEAAPYVEDTQITLAKWAVPFVRLAVMRWNGRRAEARAEARRLRESQGNESLPAWVKPEVIAAEMGDTPRARGDILRRHYEHARRRIPRGERVRALWLLAQAYDEQGDEARALVVFQQAIDEAITALSSTTLAEEGFRDQPRFRRLLGLTLDREKAADILLRVQWVRAFDKELRRRSGGSDRRGILEVRALAPMAEIAQEGRTVELRPLDRELLVFLAENGTSPIETITESLWKDRPGGSQVANLHSAIYRLRTRLGRDIIVRNESSYRISDELGMSYDVATFRDAVSRLRESAKVQSGDEFERGRDALSMYRSPFLADSRSLWATRVRADVARTFVWLSEWCGQASIDRGLLDEAIDVARNALKLDPYSDRLNAILLDALAKARRLSEFSATYRRYVTGLREELGIDPPRRLREAYASLLSSLVE